MTFLREDEKPLLKPEDSLRSLENSFEKHEHGHDVVEMFLSSVDDEPNEDTYEEIGDFDSLSRYVQMYVVLFFPKIINELLCLWYSEETVYESDFENPGNLVCF